MDKRKFWLSCMVIVLSVLFALSFFPIISLFLPDYENRTYYSNVSKPDVKYPGEYGNDIYPWQYFDKDKCYTDIDLETVNKIKEKVLSFLTATFSVDEGLSLDFSENIYCGGESFLFVKDFTLYCGDSTYNLDFSYDCEKEEFITFHCDSGGGDDRNDILSAEPVLKQKILAYKLGRELSGATNTISGYLACIKNLNNNLPHGFYVDNITVKRSEKDLFVVFPNNYVDLLLYWNPNSKQFEGFCVNLIV